MVGNDDGAPAICVEERALEWYNSEEYQELVQIRHAASTADIIAIDGRR